jgi:opacity protein-like surface antigen
VKRIAIALFVLNFVASPALADGIKGVVGTVGMGALSTMACVLTVVYLPDEEEESAEDFDRRGFFIGAGAGFAGEDFSRRPVNDIADIFSNQPRFVSTFAGPEAIAQADDSWSVKGRAGYRCHSRYSVGATFEYFGGFDTRWSGPLGMGSDDIDIFVATVDIKSYLLTGRYQPYLLLGGGTINVSTKVTNRTGINGVTEVSIPDTTDSLLFPNFGPVNQSRTYTDFVFRFGGGFDIYATDHIVVNFDANYLAPMGEASGVGMFTIGGGIEYRF